MPLAFARVGRSATRYQYGVLLAFTSLEVLLFSANASVRGATAVLEYAFLTIAVLVDLRAGLMYLLSFTLLAMGPWSYIEGATPTNFWGLRLFGVSFNIIFTIGVAAYCFAKQQSALVTRTSRPSVGFFVGFIAYSLLAGMLAVTLGINHLDNFVNDSLVYLPFFVYSYLISRLDADSVRQIVKYGLSLTIVSMLLSYTTYNVFQYQVDFQYVLMNSFAFIVLVVILFVRGMYSTAHYWFLLASVILLVASGSVFLGGKGIIVLATALIWGLFTSKRPVIVVSLAALIGLAFQGPILQVASTSLPEGSLVSYKLSQIYDVFDLHDIGALSATTTSAGNLAAEARTITAYMYDNPLVLLFGKGFGAGVPDVFGSLGAFVGAGAGYSDQAATRNEFVRMHLPIFEIVLKSGVVGLALYVLLILRTVKRKSVFAFVTVVLLLTVFTNSKEMLLLTLVFMALAAEGRQIRSTAADGADGRRLQVDRATALRCGGASQARLVPLREGYRR